MIWHGLPPALVWGLIPRLMGLLYVMAFGALGAAAVCSQSDLETLLSDVPHAADLPKECRFLESGPWAALAS